MVSDNRFQQKIQYKRRVILEHDSVHSLKVFARNDGVVSSDERIIVERDNFGVLSTKHCELKK